jgi:glycosyltransferase involved in cell wall biosynthesis
MDIALYHDLPPRGGAYRVLATFVEHAVREHAITVYTPRAPEPEQIPLELDPARIVRLRRPVPGRPVGPVWLATTPLAGRSAARRIDAAGHDVVFCHSSEFTKAPEILPYLRTPSVYYAPEVHRILYEPQETRSRGARRAGEELAKQRLRTLERRSLHAADVVVTHSAHTARSLEHIYGIDAAIVSPGVDTRRFGPGWAAGNGRPVVLSVGSLTAAKGHDFVIEAVAGMARPAPKVVVIAESGADGAELTALARRRGVDLEIRVGVTHDELVAAYRKAAVLACGQHHEPFGLVVLEAMAVGTPVVAVAEGGFVETVEDGVTGLLVARDPAAMGDALTRVLGDPALAGRLTENARDRLGATWSWEAAVAGYVALLSSVAS